MEIKNVGHGEGMHLEQSTVPVIIDSIKTDGAFPLTRCFYFYIETSTPASGWELIAPWYQGPMLLLGMAAIILGPTGGEGRFETSDDFGKLMDAFDQDEQDFYLDQNVIWLPNFVLAGDGHERGSVYRLSLEAFRLAYAFTEEHLGQGEFLELSYGLQEGIRFSLDETKAFQQWDEELLAFIRDDYRENRKEMLSKKDG